MQNETTPQIFQAISELGSFIRSKRKQAGYATLESGAKAFSVGRRFLSEVERGKVTAEIGKVLDVLHGLGLDLAVVPRELNSTQPVRRFVKPLSRELGLDFPYDWSNPGMNEDIFIHNVLEKGRFMDVLRLARHYGVDRIEAAAQEFVATPNWPRLSQILDRIRVGKDSSSVGCDRVKAAD